VLINENGFYKVAAKFVTHLSFVGEWYNEGDPGVDVANPPKADVVGVDGDAVVVDRAVVVSVRFTAVFEWPGI